MRDEILPRKECEQRFADLIIARDTESVERVLELATKHGKPSPRVEDLSVRVFTLPFEEMGPSFASRLSNNADISPLMEFVEVIFSHVVYRPVVLRKISDILSESARAQESEFEGWLDEECED